MTKNRNITMRPYPSTGKSVIVRPNTQQWIAGATNTVAYANGGITPNVVTSPFSFTGQQVHTGKVRRMSPNTTMFAAGGINKAGYVNIASGAASGAAMGAVGGPWGMAAGALIGGGAAVVSEWGKGKERTATADFDAAQKAKSDALAAAGIRAEDTTATTAYNNNITEFAAGGINKGVKIDTSLFDKSPNYNKAMSQSSNAITGYWLADMWTDIKDEYPTIDYNDLSTIDKVSREKGLGTTDGNNIISRAIDATKLDEALAMYEKLSYNNALSGDIKKYKANRSNESLIDNNPNNKYVSEYVKSQRKDLPNTDAFNAYSSRQDTLTLAEIARVRGTAKANSVVSANNTNTASKKLKPQAVATSPIKEGTAAIKEGTAHVVDSDRVAMNERANEEHRARVGIKTDAEIARRQKIIDDAKFKTKMVAAGKAAEDGRARTREAKIVADAEFSNKLIEGGSAMEDARVKSRESNVVKPVVTPKPTTKLAPLGTGLLGVKDGSPNVQDAKKILKSAADGVFVTDSAIQRAKKVLADNDARIKERNENLAKIKNASSNNNTPEITYSKRKRNTKLVPVSSTTATGNGKSSSKTTTKTRGTVKRTPFIPVKFKRSKAKPGHQVVSGENGKFKVDRYNTYN